MPSTKTAYTSVAKDLLACVTASHRQLRESERELRKSERELREFKEAMATIADDNAAPDWQRDSAELALEILGLRKTTA